MNINWFENVSWHEIWIKTVLVVASVVLIVWAMPREASSLNYKVEVGKPWRYADLTAPFDFPVYKSEERVKAERDSLLKDFEPYYNLKPDVEGTQVRQFAKDYSNGIPGLSSDYISIIANRLHGLYQQGIMQSGEYNMMDTTRAIRIVTGKSATTVPITRVYSTVSAYEQLFADPSLANFREQLQKCNLNDYITPNLIYDRDRSEASQNDMLSNIPLAVGLVQHGQKIVGRGDIVDEKAYNTIESFFRENDRRHQTESKLSTPILGQILDMSLFIISFTIFLSLFRNDYFENMRTTAMLYALIILFSVLTSLMVSHTFMHVFLIPYAMVPILIRVFMDSRTAFMAHVTMILICASILQHPYEFIAVETMAGLVAIFTLRELSSRSQLFWTAVLVTGAAMLTNLSISLLTINDLDFRLIDPGEYNYLLICGVLLFCSYPLLYIIEKAFSFTSSITLIELSDMNKTLLRRMSEVAPGTFQHSTQVGNLAVEIARKIGAKSLLVRTGALYHDIGKIMNPAYFTENQVGVNPHDSLTYIDSAQMLISHVTEGIKLADKYNLPKEIKDFIQTHHGQGKTKYFYIKQKNDHPDEVVDDLLFTYPGPNPFTKEQAILMMADAVEAASRSLPDYTEQSIRELVNRIIDSQVSDGYFRECPITFRDIQYAKTVLIEKLKTIYHTRISYPELKKG